MTTDIEIKEKPFNQEQPLDLGAEIYPQGDVIVVRELRPAEKIGMIWLPDESKEKEAERGDSKRGVIIAIGPGKEKPITGLTIGDMIVYANYAGAPLKFKNSKDAYKMINREDVLVKIVVTEVEEEKK